jgi:hypothetical protein
MKPASRLFHLAIISAGLMAHGAANATACPVGYEVCTGEYRVTLNLATSQLADGNWQYDYTAKLAVVRYNGGVAPAPEPVSSPYTFVRLELPYFSDAGIANVRVGSDYASTLSAHFETNGPSSQSIVVSTIGPAISTQSPDTLISGVNSLLSFTSAYAPTAATGTLILVDIMMNQGRNVSLVRAVGIPGSPMAIASVPELPMGAMTVLGLLAMGAAVQRRDKSQG